ncbi:MAG: GtrA family protein [Propionibacteriaceae bacterium]|jgi:putative flippase GtrA|nr:GtrA family protein [Propionibacteriaceae bacterium]
MTESSLRPQIRRSQIITLVKFGAVGVASAAIDFGVFYLLAEVIGWVPWLATTISFLCAFGVNYRGNRDIVFKAGKVPGAIFRYIILVIVNWILSALTVTAGVALGLPAVAAKIISMILVAVINFVVQRLWVFRVKQPSVDVESDPDRGRDESELRSR